MIAQAGKLLSTVMRIALVGVLLTGPVAGLAASHQGAGTGVKGAGLVLFISLQRTR